MDTITETAVAAPHAEDVLHVVGDEIVVKLPGEIAAGAFEVFEVTGPEESGPPPHAHPWLEAYYILDGEVDTTLDGVTTRSTPGTFVTIPAGTVHAYRVATPTARFLVMTAGDRASRFFADLDANAPHGMPTPEALGAIITVAKRNGLTSPLF